MAHANLPALSRKRKIRHVLGSLYAVQLPPPGDLNGAIPAGDTFDTTYASGQRNIFRQPWQRRTDLSVIKMTQLAERVGMRFTFEVFNLTNTPSFNIPINKIQQP
jgi:hypothetical protein